MASPYKIHLDTYDGPLDLLLDLIKKQEIDIHNIPIAKITGQYLEYLHKLEQLDMDISADFIYMAATLIYIKSKMLLPPDPLAGPEQMEDPRADLVHRLVEHEKFKSAAQLLHQRQQIEENVWSKPDRSLYEGEEVEGELIVSLVDLVKVFQQVLERRKEIVKIELRHDQFTVAQMMELLRQQLVVSDEGIDLVRFFESCASRHAMIVALLAVLELVRLQAIMLVQENQFGEIRLRKHKMFDVVFAGGESIGEQIEAAFRAPGEEEIDPKVKETETPPAGIWVFRHVKLNSKDDRRKPVLRIRAITMNPIELKGALEAIIYAADDPATLDQIANAVGEEKSVVRAALDEMITGYAGDERGMEIRAVAGGYRFYTKPQHHEVVRRFIKSLRPPLRLTMPALETLAVISYRQPVTGPEIQEIRGVSASGVIKTLLEKRLIVTAGRKAVMGRPILYRTSKEFLMRFGLSDLDELPSLKEFEQLARAALGADEGIAPAEPEEMPAGPEQTPVPLETAEISPEMVAEPASNEVPNTPQGSDFSESIASGSSDAAANAGEILVVPDAKAESAS